MTAATRSEIDELYAKYKDRVLRDSKGAVLEEALTHIGQRLSSQSGPPSQELRDLGRIIKVYLPELSGKQGVDTAHGHFTVAVLLYATGTDLQRALKRARVEYDKNLRHLKIWLNHQTYRIKRTAS